MEPATIRKILIGLFGLYLIIGAEGFSQSLTVSSHESPDYCPHYDQQDPIEARAAEKCEGDNYYRAAIFEHNRIDLPDIVETAKRNLAIFEDVAKRASSEGAKIIVFPEDGIFHRDVETMMPILERIPDPEKLDSSSNNPCTQPELFESYVLKNLSCIARNNNIYIVANFGTKSNCEPGRGVGDYQTCPNQGFLALNTDVIIDSSGNYVRRYHKFNMFLEVFDKSPQLEIVTLDTPFGRLGIFTCFDMLFKAPAISLVEEKKVDTILFPTWWFDELPILTAIQFQDAWSQSNDVNLLAANINRLELGSIGSGIFGGNEFVYTVPSDAKSRLLVATIPKKRSEMTQKVDFNSTVITFDHGRSQTPYLHLSYEITSDDVVYVLDLDGSYHKKRYCKNEVCCDIVYQTTRNVQAAHQGQVILIVRDGRRPGKLNWYEQVCLVATVAKPYVYETYSREGIVGFKLLQVSGTFGSKYVFPTAAHKVSRLVSRHERLFRCDQDDKVYKCHLSYRGGQEKPIYSFGLYGRLYQLDRMPSELQRPKEH